MASLLQVPGGEALAQTAPSVATLAAQALSLFASQLPHGWSTNSDCLLFNLRQTHVQQSIYNLWVNVSLWSGGG